MWVVGYDPPQMNTYSHSHMKLDILLFVLPYFTTKMSSEFSFHHHQDIQRSNSITVPIPCQPTKKSTQLAFEETLPATPLISSFLILTRGLRIRLMMQPFHFHQKITMLARLFSDPFEGDSQPPPAVQIAPTIKVAPGSIHQLPSISNNVVSSPVMPMHV